MELNKLNGRFKNIINEHESVFYGAIIIISILLMGKVVGFASFNSWDDGLHVSNNYYVTNRTLGESLKYFWTNIHKGLFMPLTYSVWKLVWVLFDQFFEAQKAMVYHFLCLLFHTINACLVLKIFKKLKLNHIAAFLGALIFLLHPVQVESFAWISEFKGIFAFFWCATATIQLINWKENRKALPYFLAVLFFAFALFSKPSSVTLPFLFIAIWFFTEKKYALSETKIKQYSLLAVFFAMSAVLAIITRIAQPASVGLYDGLPVFCRVIIPLHALGFYLSQLIIPAPLVNIYPDQLPADIMKNMGSQFYWLLGILAVILPVRYKKFRWIWLFTLLILPNSGAMPFDYQLISCVADRYQYLVMPVAIFGIFKLIDNFNIAKISVIFIVLIIFAFMTSKRTNDWENTGTLHLSAIFHNKKTPHLYINLSKFFMDTDQLEAAKKVFEIADSNEVKSDLLDQNRAVFFNVSKETDSAIVVYRKIISSFLGEDGNMITDGKRYDHLMNASIGYGNLMVRKKDYDEAILSFNVSKPFAQNDIQNFIRVNGALSEVYRVRSKSDSAKDGDLDSSLAYSSSVLSVDKKDPAALFNKYMIFRILENEDSASVYFEKFSEVMKGKNIYRKGYQIVPRL